MSFQEYLEQFQQLLGALLATGEAQLIEFQADARSQTRGYVGGVLLFADGSELHFREFLDTQLDKPRLTYAYHFQDVNKGLLFRYDNAAHRPALSQAEHKHTVDGIVLSPAPTLADVLDEIGVW